MTVSEYIYDYLQKKGVKTVYMVSGSSAMWLTDALYRNKEIKAVCTHHEQAAAMSADLYGRHHGIPGVALVTIGPGATNAITGVAEAYVDSSPMFVLSGQASSRLLAYMQETGIRQQGTQSLDLEPMVSSITKYFAAVMQPDDILEHMDRAYEAAMSGRKGPVWIDIPVDIQNRQISRETLANYKLQVKNQKYNKLEENKIQDVIERMKIARKPLILAGGGISREDLDYLVHKTNFPVVTTRMGIDRISSDSAYYVGRIGAYGQRAAHYAVQQADFIIVIGSRLSVSSIGYYPQRFGENAYKVQVDLDQKELDKTDVLLDEKLFMDSHQFVQCIQNEFIVSHDKWREYCVSLRERYPIVINEYRQSNPMNSYYFTEILTKVAPEDVSVVVDTGSVSNVVAQTWHVKEKQKFYISGGLSCMGFWAGAMGCCQGTGEVIALSGDGSVSMNIQEFATLKYYHLPIKLFVYQNNGYMLIRHNQHNYMEDRFLGVGPDSGIQTPDYCAVAKAYGLPFKRIAYGDNLERQIQKVLEMDGPVICEVMLENFGPMAPRIASKVMPDGSLKAAEFDDLAPFLEEDDKPELFVL